MAERRRKRHKHESRDFTQMKLLNNQCSTGKQASCKKEQEDIISYENIEELQTDPQEPTKEEMKMAKYVRFNTPKKATIMQKENVEYFIGSKAVDTLMKSKWSKQSKKADPILQSRGDAVRFMEQLLLNNMLYRAKKVLKEAKPTKEEQKSKASKNIQDGKTEKVRKRNKEKEEKETEETKETDAAKTEEKKKKKKYKLDVHEEQIFLDSSDVYIWIYDPLSPKKILLGGVVLLGIIGATLFPLWPPSVRIGVYYLSVCGGVFVGSILTVALCRSLLFVVIWLVTMGNHHVWFLPNLLADVGFFDSFKPLYTHDVRDEKKDKNDKDKNSDSEKEDDEPSPQPVDGDKEPETIARADENNDNIEGEKPDDDILSQKRENDIAQRDSDSQASASERNSQSEEDRGSASDYEIIEGSVKEAEA